jgi:hypothetical protein
MTKPLKSGELKRRAKRRAKLRDEKVIIDAVDNIKKARGGKREGAGRPPNHLRGTNTPPLTAHAILLCVDEQRYWMRLLRDQSASIRLQTLTYLKNREQGMPTQRAEVEATVFNPLSAEELAATTELQKAEMLLKYGANWLLEWGRHNIGDLKKCVAEVEDQLKNPKPAPIAALPPAPPAPDYSDTLAPKYETATAVIPPEAEPLLSCPKHGDYFKPKNQRSNMCPQCIADGALDEKRLQSLLPGAMA